MNKNIEKTIERLMKEKCNTCEKQITCDGIHQYNCITEGFILYKKVEEKINMINKNDMLEEIFNTQKQLQENTMGYNFKDMDDKQRARYIKDMMFWTNDEMSEATHNLPYAKDWSKKYDKPEYNKEEQWLLFKEEMIDALHFFMNILIAANMTPEEILKMYLDKNKENIDRQKRGY